MHAPLHSCSFSSTSHSPPHHGEHEPPIPPHARSPLCVALSRGQRELGPADPSRCASSWPLGAVIMASAAAVDDQLKIINEEIIAL